MKENILDREPNEDDEKYKDRYYDDFYKFKYDLYIDDLHDWLAELKAEYWETHHAMIRFREASEELGEYAADLYDKLEEVRDWLERRPIKVEPMAYDTYYENLPEPERDRYYYDKSRFKDAFERWLEEVSNILEVNK